MPAPILKSLGIQPLTEQEFRLADGTNILQKKGIALLKYRDKIGGAEVTLEPTIPTLYPRLGDRGSFQSPLVAKSFFKDGSNQIVNRNVIIG